MIWPPVKAWTSILFIEGQKHFVAINYGGELLDRWVIMMSVLDASLLIKVSWSQLVDPYNWKCGWDYSSDNLNTYKLANSKYETLESNYADPSLDSGLTIPITKNIIRPWFENT